MPYKSQFIKLPRNYDRRVKLTDEDRSAIQSLYRQGTGIREIARQYPQVSRRLIQFVLFPDRAAKARARFKKHWKEYVNRKKLTNATRNLRQYKHSLFKAGKIK